MRKSSGNIWDISYRHLYRVCGNSCTVFNYMKVGIVYDYVYRNSHVTELRGSFWEDWVLKLVPPSNCVLSEPNMKPTFIEVNAKSVKLYLPSMPCHVLPKTWSHPFPRFMKLFSNRHLSSLTTSSLNRWKVYSALLVIERGTPKQKSQIFAAHAPCRFLNWCRLLPNGGLQR